MTKTTYNDLNPDMISEIISRLNFADTITISRVNKLHYVLHINKIETKYDEKQNDVGFCVIGSAKLRTIVGCLIPKNFNVKSIPNSWFYNCKCVSCGYVNYLRERDFSKYVVIRDVLSKTEVGGFLDGINWRGTINDPTLLEIINKLPIGLINVNFSNIKTTHLEVNNDFGKILTPKWCIFGCSTISGDKLVEINLQSVKLKQITLNTPNLSGCNLKNNELTKIPDFSRCPGIKELYLGKNKIIDEIPIDLTGLSKLQVLSLHRNKLKSFPIFNPISYVDLRMNNITEICSFGFLPNKRKTNRLRLNLNPIVSVSHFIKNSEDCAFDLINTKLTKSQRLELELAYPFTTLKF